MKKIKYFIWFLILFISAKYVNAQDIYINSTVNYNTNQNVSGDIYIQSNGLLTITAEVFMNPDKTIYIENGGQLRILNQGKLDEQVSGQPWQGIEVQSGGKLVMDNAFVYNAKIAVYSEYTDALNQLPNNEMSIDNSLIKYCSNGVLIRNRKTDLLSFSFNTIEDAFLGFISMNTQTTYYLVEPQITCSNHGILFTNSGLLLEGGTISAPVPVYLFRGDNSIIAGATLDYEINGIYCNNSQGYFFADNTIVGQFNPNLNVPYSIGINVINSHGQISYNPYIKSSHIGIFIYGGYSLITENIIDIDGYDPVDNGGIINANSYSHIGLNEIEVSNGTFGINSIGVSSNNSILTNNIIDISSWGISGAAGIKSEANVGERIDDNEINSWSSCDGIHVQNSLDNKYTCNIIDNALAALNIANNSEDALIRGNEFNTSDIDLIIRSVTGVQDRHGNLFSELNSKARAYDLDNDGIFNSRFIANPSISRHWPDDIVPVSGWFQPITDTNYFDDCVNQGTEPPGFFEDSLALCTFYNNIKALKTSNPNLYFVKIYHLLLLEYFKENYSLPACIDKESLYKELCGMKELLTQVYALSQINGPLEVTHPLYQSSEQMKTLQMEYLNASDSITKLNKVLQIQALSSLMWPGMTQKYLSDSLSYESVKTELQKILCQEYIVQVWKNTLLAHVDFLQSGEVTSGNKNILETYSQLCSDEYGDMIHLARALESSYNSTYYDVYDGCLRTLTQRSTNDQTIELGGLIKPNPNQGEFTVELNKMTSGSYIVSDLQGRIVQQSKFGDCEQLNIVLGEQSGMYNISIETEAGEKLLLKSITVER